MFSVVVKGNASEFETFYWTEYLSNDAPATIRA